MILGIIQKRVQLSYGNNANSADLKNVVVQQRNHQRDARHLAPGAPHAMMPDGRSKSAGALPMPPFLALDKVRSAVTGRYDIYLHLAPARLNHIARPRLEAVFPENKGHKLLKILPFDGVAYAIKV
jgi:hypothetical protein